MNNMEDIAGQWTIFLC